MSLKNKIVIENKLFGVITGDIVNSSKIDVNKRDLLLDTLKCAFNEVSIDDNSIIQTPFQIYRGDSFQGVLMKPEKTLFAGLIIRSVLRYKFALKQSDALDSRISIGIGSINYSADTSAEGDGEAFRFSGPMLDNMKTAQRFSIVTPWSDFNKELFTQCALLDAIIHKWSAQQAEVISCLLKGFTQEEISNKIGISQPAIRKRLLSAGGYAIEKLVDRFESIICSKVH